MDFLVISGVIGVLDDQAMIVDNLESLKSSEGLETLLDVVRVQGVIFQAEVQSCTFGVNDVVRDNIVTEFPRHEAYGFEYWISSLTRGHGY